MTYYLYTDSAGNQFGLSTGDPGFIHVEINGGAYGESAEESYVIVGPGEARKIARKVKEIIARVLTAYEYKGCRERQPNSLALRRRAAYGHRYVELAICPLGKTPTAGQTVMIPLQDARAVARRFREVAAAVDVRVAHCGGDVNPSEDHQLWGHTSMWSNNYPGPNTLLEDWLELSHERWWCLGQETPDSIEGIPRMWIEQYREGVPLENSYNEEDVTGRVWLYPEDLPMVIAKLTELLASYRRCALEDSKRHPPPNWGDLLVSDEDPRGR